MMFALAHYTTWSFVDIVVAIVIVAACIGIRKGAGENETVR